MCCEAVIDMIKINLISSYLWISPVDLQSYMNVKLRATSLSVIIVTITCHSHQMKSLRFYSWEKINKLIKTISTVKLIGKLCTHLTIKI